jgi:putative protein-disulfide isomerase
MSTAILHYLYDPFCGWCYGAAPMISAAMSVPGVHVQPHGIGMLSGDKSKMMSAQWRDFVRPHEARITFYSKQTFGEAYVNGVQQRDDVVLDSSPPIAAMQVAEAMSGRGVEMLKRLQVAYYQQGRPIADIAELCDLAESLGYDLSVFSQQLLVLLDNGIEQHLQASQALMRRIGAQGVPAFALEIDDHWEVLPLGHYLSRPALFRKDIEARVQAVNAA